MGRQCKDTTSASGHACRQRSKSHRVRVDEEVGVVRQIWHESFREMKRKWKKDNALATRKPGRARATELDDLLIRRQTIRMLRPQQIAWALHRQF